MKVAGFSASICFVCFLLVPLAADEPANPPPPRSAPAEESTWEQRLERLQEAVHHELDGWSEQHGDRWQRWAEHVESSVERWAEDQEHVWERWAERYSDAVNDRNRSQEKLTSSELGAVLEVHLDMISRMPLGQAFRSGFEVAAERTGDAPWDSLQGVRESCERLFQHVGEQAGEVRRQREQAVEAEVEFPSRSAARPVTAAELGTTSPPESEPATTERPQVEPSRKEADIREIRRQLRQLDTEIQRLQSELREAR